MKIKQGLFALFFVTASLLRAQDIGKVIIKNAKDNFPKFIVSMNGIRLSNDYSSSVTFNYLDDYTYKVNILQAGSRNTLSFMVYSAPNYVSTFVIGKDNYGNYLFNLESKVIMSDSSSVASASATTATTQAKPHGTTVATPVTASVTPGAVIDEDEYFDIIKTLKKETIEKNRLEMAKTFFGTKWLLASMVKDAIKIFNLEATKVAFAKFAYGRTVDKQNYYKVFDTFNLSNSKKEMNEFIKTNP